MEIVRTHRLEDFIFAKKAVVTREMIDRAVANGTIRPSGAEYLLHILEDK
jgi:hypothetical protein